MRRRLGFNSWSETGSRVCAEEEEGEGGGRRRKKKEDLGGEGKVVLQPRVRDCFARLHTETARVSRRLRSFGLAPSACPAEPRSSDE